MHPGQQSLSPQQSDFAIPQPTHPTQPVQPPQPSRVPGVRRGHGGQTAKRQMVPTKGSFGHVNALCLLALAMALLLVSCAHGTKSTTDPINTPGQRVQAGPPTLSFNSTGNDTAGGLFAHGLFDCPHNLVLASDQLSYSDSDVQQMLTYMSGFGLNGSIPTASLPSSLTWVPGADVNAVDATGPGTIMIFICHADLTITNTTGQDVTITGGGVRNVSAPTTNAYQYRTIDFCDLQQNQRRIPDSSHPGWCNQGAGPVCAYGLLVPLGPGDASTDYTNTFDTEGCQTIDLPAHQSADIMMVFESQVPLIYFVHPELIVTDTSGTHSVVFAGWSNSLAFATESQMPCYGLNQTTFSLETNNADCS